MASKTTTLSQAMLDLVFLNTAITGIGDAGGLLPSAAAGNLYLSGHSADPAEGGDQTSSELSYTGYGRIAAARSGAAWSRTGKAISNVAALLFGLRSDAGAAQELAYVGVGSASSGAGKLLYRAPVGAITAALAFTAVGSSNVFTIPGLSGAVNDKVAIFGGPNVTLPAGVTEGTIVFIKTVSGNDYTLSTTAGGSTLDIGDGAGFIAKVSPLSVTQNVNPQIAAGQIVIRED